MEEMLKLLIKLQDIDSRLFELEKAKGNLPAEVSELKEHLNQKEQQLNAVKEEYEKSGQDKRHHELEITSLEDQMAKYKKQIYSVKTNKEYDAITAEIETTEIEISDLETQVLLSLDKEESLKTQLEIDQKMVEETRFRAKEKEAALNRLIKMTEKDLEELRRQRNELTPPIDKPILAKYERIRKGKGVIVVTPIDNGRCTGCYSNLPPQMTMEIKRMDQLIYCQYCGRILIYQNEQDESKLSSEME